MWTIPPPDFRHDNETGFHSLLGFWPKVDRRGHEYGFIHFPYDLPRLLTFAVRGETESRQKQDRQRL